jgi:superfamily I DNA/RNA helicase
MTIQNPERLEHELEQNPISVLNDDFDIEVIDALETATTLPMVELMSIAKSKGLSAQHVMVLGCDGTNMLLDDISPLSFYVAMTRARESLHLVTSLKARGSAGAATHFAYLPEEHCDFLSFTTKGATDLGTYAGFVQQLRRWNRMMTLPRKKR